MLWNWIIIFTAALLSLYIIERFDHAAWMPGHRELVKILFLSGLNALWIDVLPNMDLIQKTLLAVLAGMLLFASTTDCKRYEVFQFTWWVAGSAAFFLYGYRNYFWSSDTVSPPSSFYMLLIYVVLQESFFCRTYGRADCHAFAVCALAECAFGMDITWYFFQMVLAFILLTTVQAVRHNIGTRGRLKYPAAFIPYISASFWILFSMHTAGGWKILNF